MSLHTVHGLALRLCRHIPIQLAAAGRLLFKDMKCWMPAPARLGGTGRSVSKLMQVLLKV
jgi:hypothetical protein